MKLYRVDVSAYSNNAIRKEDGRFYMACEVDAEIDALKAENERLRKDAERYRWLREQHWNESYFAVVCFPKKSVRLGADCPSLLRLDEAIDAAMSALPDTKGE